MRFVWIVGILCLAGLATAALDSIPVPGTTPPTAPTENASAPTTTPTVKNATNTTIVIPAPSNTPVVQPYIPPTSTPPTQLPNEPDPILEDPTYEEPAVEEETGFFSSWLGIASIALIVIAIVGAVLLMMGHRKQELAMEPPRVLPPEMPRGFPSPAESPAPLSLPEPKPMPSSTAQGTQPMGTPLMPVHQSMPMTSSGVPIHFDPGKLETAKSYIAELRIMGMKDHEILDLLKDAGWPAAYISRGINEMPRGGVV